MPLMRACLLLFTLLLSAAHAFADTQRFTLDNGLTLLVSEMPGSPVAAIHVWVKTGSANEGRYMGSGITHFVEHMLFKGTTRRGPGDIPQEARSLGGYTNASTGYDHTVYILSLPKDNLEKGIDLLADMVAHPSFDSAEVEKEREVILKEMRMINDRPEHKLDELVYQSVYHVHPYQYPIIGREDIFRSLKRDDLVDYHRSLYVPNNMIVSVAGGVRAAQVISMVKDKFGTLRAAAFPLRDVPQEPQQISSRRTDAFYDSALTRLSLAYQGVPLLDPDLYPLDVLAMALGQGASSRLYLDLYKSQRMVESIWSVNDTPQDRGFFEISAVLKDQPSDKVIARIKAMIADVQTHGLRPDELEKIKRQVMADNIFDRQTAEGLSDKTAADLAYTGDHRFSDAYLEGVRAVTNETIKRVARQYLVESRLNTVIMRPASSRSEPGVAAPETTPVKIEKSVLANGMVLLLIEDHTIPIVAVNALFNGGMRQESIPLNGLSSLLGSVWSKGLPGMTADQIHQEVESRGASVSSYSGRNSFVLSMNFLSRDNDRMFDLFTRILTRPSFPQVEIDRDKRQLLTALIARKDNVLQTSSRELVELLFKTHPYRLDPIGTPDGIARIRRSDLLAVFQRYIRSDNGVIAVAGDFDPVKVKRDLTLRLARLPTGRPELKTFREEFPQATRLKEITQDKEQAAVMVAFRGPTIKDEDRCAVDTAVNILSSSLGGRLFKRIRDELGKSYSVSGSSSPGVDAGMVMFFALTTNEGIARVRSIMEEEFARLRNDLVSPQELSDARNYLKGDMARDLQILGERSLTRAVDEMLGLGYEYIDSYDARIDRLTREDIRNAARKYFDINTAAVVISRSRASLGVEKSRE